MNEWMGLFPVLARLLVSFGALAAALVVLVVALLQARNLALARAGRRGGAGEAGGAEGSTVQGPVGGLGKMAKPRRPGKAELARLIARAEKRPYARDRLAERLRRLARDAAALRLGTDEPSAREAIETGVWGGDPRLSAFLREDFLSRGGAGARSSFMYRLRDMIGLLADYAHTETAPQNGAATDEKETQDEK